MYIPYSKKLWRVKNFGEFGESQQFANFFSPISFPAFVIQGACSNVSCALFCVRIQVLYRYCSLSSDSLVIHTDHRLYIAPRHPCHRPSSNTLLAHSTCKILENTEFVLLCSSMFGIASFYCLSMIGNWRCNSKFAKVFFRQCLAVALFAKLFDCQSFLL